MDLWTSPTDRREPCGPCGQPVDNADVLPTACPHSRASRPQAPQDQPPVILRGQHRTTLRRGCLHRPFKTTSASHSNRSQHRPRPGSPPSLQAHFRMGLDFPAYDTWNHGWGGPNAARSGGRHPRSRNPVPVRWWVGIRELRCVQMWIRSFSVHGNGSTSPPTCYGHPFTVDGRAERGFLLHFGRVRSRESVRYGGWPERVDPVLDWIPSPARPGPASIGRTCVHQPLSP